MGGSEIVISVDDDGICFDKRIINIGGKTVSGFETKQKVQQSCEAQKNFSGS